MGRVSGRRRRGGLLNNVSANIKKSLDSLRSKAKPRIRGGGGLGLSHLSGLSAPIWVNFYPWALEVTGKR